MLAGLLGLVGLGGTPLGAQQFELADADRVPANVLFSTGMAWGDYDGDGFVDLYVTNWGTGTGLTPINALYHNTGGVFQRVDEQVGLNVIINGGNSTDAAWGDYDDDGDLDLYLGDFSDTDYLFENQAGQFVEVGRGAAAIDQVKLGSTTSVAWGDYDNDGRLDIYLGKYYYDNQLYHNGGDKTFSRVDDLGVGDKRDADAVCWVDYDNDGDLDIYAVNREQANVLYRNELSEGGAFAEVACALSVDNWEIGQDAAWGDYDNDGDSDLVVANIGANALYRNDGGDAFVEVGQAAGVRLAGSGWLTAAAAWADYNGDGWLDLYLATGADRQPQSDALLVNNGDGTFSDFTAGAGVPLSPSYHMAAAWADFDGDGAPDLYVSDGAAQGNQLLRNSTDSSRFVKVRVQGKGAAAGGSNTSGIGAQVWLLDAASSEIRGYRQIATGGEEAIFGVGDQGSTYRVVVIFAGSDETVTVDDVSGGTAPIQVIEP